MSHSTKLALGGGGGGTLDGLTANIGLPAVPDGAHNINIVGAGVIQTTVDPLAPNTIRIESSEVAATFDCDTGSAVPVAGAIDIIGTITQIETTGFGSTVQLALADNINIVGTLDTGGDVTGGGSLTVTDNIIAATGDISAPLGNATIGGNITASDLDITGAATIAGSLQLSWLLHGVLRVDDAGIVTSSDGENGQLLIGSSTGPSQWRSLTPGTGIQIVDGENLIIVSTSDIVARIYIGNTGSATPLLGELEIRGETNISTDAGLGAVRISLNNDITLNSVRAEDITGYANIYGHKISITGDMSSSSVTTGTATITSNINCFGNLKVCNIDAIGTFDLNGDADISGDTTIGGDLIVGEDASITGELKLSTHTSGVLTTDATGFIEASNGSPEGTNGQVLISGGARPAWHALESADGSVQITYPAANRINLKATSAIDKVAFQMNMQNLVTWDANNIERYYYFGQKTPLTIPLDTHGTCYAGDGAAAKAYFTPPYIGYYFINASVTIRKAPGYESSWILRNAYIALEDITNNKVYIIHNNVLESPINSAGLLISDYIATMSCSGMHLLNPTHRYSIKVYLHARADAVSQHFAIGVNPIPGGYDAYTGFEGFEVLRL